MKRPTLVLLPLSLVIVCASASTATAGLGKGDPAPPFELESVKGQAVSSSRLGDGGLSIVAFISLESKPSRELAVSLANVVKEHADDGISVVVVAGDSPDALEQFAEQHSLGYEVCADASKETLKRYGAEHVVPIIYLVGPGGSIAKVVRGGGMMSQQVLLAVAEKQFARGDADTAGELYSKVAAEDPKNVEARAGAGFALAKQGKLERAEEEFQAIGKLGGDGKSAAAEGLAEVALRRGDLDGAAEKARSAEGGYASLIRGEVAARRGDLGEAQREFQVASAKEGRFPWQQALGFNNLARVTKEKGDLKKAVQVYDQAIEKEPFLVEARSNQAVALEKSGRLDDAKKTLSQAKKLAPDNELVATLLRRIEQREKEKLDLERQKLTNELVNDLVAAYRSGKLPKAPADEWSPRRLVVSFLDVKNQLGLTAPDGIPEAFLQSLTRELQDAGRVTVVEREVIDKLLAELKLGSSELADPATRLKLGRVLAATVIGTGGFYPASRLGELQLRMIDTETTEVRSTISENLESADRVATLAAAVAKQIGEKLRTDYPLHAKIAEVDGGEIVVGAGRKHGVAPGFRFKVVKDGAPVEVDGEVVGYRQTMVGTLEVTKAEDGFAYAKAVDGRDFQKGQKLLEAGAE